MREDYLKLMLPPSTEEKSLANRAANANPITSNQFVPKRTKPTQSEISSGSAPASPEPEMDSARPRRTSGTKKVRTTAAKKRTVARKTKSAAPVQPSDEEIRLRAYFISERRRRFDLPGDASADWLEAKRQLLSEAGRR
jgi:hypothetical protein